MTSRLALGTVQFGLDYGVANSNGRVSFDEAEGIVNEALSLGITTLDTAIGYGNSEALLGRIGVESARIITKLPDCPELTDDIDHWMQEQIEASLSKLNVEQVHGVLLHRPAQLLTENGEAIFAGLERLKALGLTKKIGISIYAPDELDAICPKFNIDIVQSPLNILDQRLATSGWSAQLHKENIEIHIRSVFLQGLLLMNREKRPSFFDRWQPVWKKWDSWLIETGLTPLEACLRFVLSISEIDQVVVGVDSLKHLNEIVEASTGDLPSLPRWPENYDADLLNPSLWKLS